MDLTGKTALVTGASRNIGQQIAVTLAAAGADVGITARSNEKGCEETARRIAETGVDTTTILGDLGVDEDIDKIASHVQSELGDIDILINNATVRPKKPFLDVTAEDLSYVMDVNIKGTYRLTQKVAPAMIENGGGAVLNLIGAFVYLGRSGKSHSYTTKMAIEGQVRQLASELGPKGIRVNAISPGHIDTVRDGEYHAEEQLIQAIPLQRAGTVSEVADTCCFLVSDHASFITGQVIHVNGGAYPTPNIVPTE